MLFSAAKFLKCKAARYLTKR